MDERTRREVDGLLREQYEAVKALLLENQVEVNRLARALAEKGELEAEDVRRLLNGKLPPRTTDAVMAPEPPPVEVEAMIPAALSNNFE
jgi:hypothetical protein